MANNQNNVHLSKNISDPDPDFFYGRQLTNKTNITCYTTNLTDISKEISKISFTDVQVAKNIESFGIEIGEFCDDLEAGDSQ